MQSPDYSTSDLRRTCDFQGFVVFNYEIIGGIFLLVFS